MTFNNNKMKKINFISIIFTLLAITSIVSCQKMDVGYLKVENASYEPDTVYAYRIVDPESDRFINKSPWTSFKIQGIAGTNPINYEFHDVKSESSSGIPIFKEAVENEEITVHGSIVQLFQSAVDKLPDGAYVISLRVYNEGYSEILEDVITFIIKDEPGDEAYR